LSPQQERISNGDKGCPPRTWELDKRPDASGDEPSPPRTRESDAGLMAVRGERVRVGIGGPMGHGWGRT
jgi:hypothetical protein